MVKKLKTIIIILLFLATSLSTYAYAVDSGNTNNLKIEKVSNPDAGEGEADGLVEGGDRETSYAWAMATRGDYIYIGTNRNIVGSVADTFAKAMESAGVSQDVAWELINSMTNNEIPRPTTEDGGEIFKYNMTTGEMKKIYTAEAGVAFRMAVEFEGDLYFASYSAVAGADNYIYKIDENDNMTIAFTSSNGTSLRASCVYDDKLLFGGVDARIELDEGYEDYQKLAILEKDPNDDTKWERIADYKDFKDYGADAAVYSTIASPIWDMCTYNGYIYAVIPNSRGMVMFKGHPAEGDEQANEYGWYWEEVIGKYNGVNNLGLAEDPEGYTGEEAGLVTMTATPFTFKDQLYLMNFDNTISATVSAVTGIVSEIANRDVKPSDYLKTMYITLNNPQKLWKYNKENGKFEEVEGFSKYMKNNCIEYVWRAETYNDELYITTMDSAILYKYIKNLKGTYFVDLTDEELEGLNSKIDELLSTIDGIGSGIEQIDQIKSILENFKVMLDEFKTSMNDGEAFFDFVIKYEELIGQIEELGSGENPLINMAGEEFVELYNKFDWEGLKMYAYIAKTIDNDVWGFDLLKSSDGENFEIVTDSGFNDKYNYGGRSLIATDNGLYVGTANPFYGAQLWRISYETDDPDPENPDDEKPDPENPDDEKPDPENPDDEKPDPENPDDEKPDPENPDNEKPDPDDDKIQDEFQDQIKDPDKLTDGLNDINNSYNLNASKNDGTTAQTQLPKAGEKYITIMITLGAVGILGAASFKYFKYKNIDKH